MKFRQTKSTISSLMMLLRADVTSPLANSERRAGSLWVTSSKTCIEHNQSALTLTADMPADMNFRSDGPLADMEMRRPRFGSREAGYRRDEERARTIALRIVRVINVRLHEGENSPWSLAIGPGFFGLFRKESPKQRAMPFSVTWRLSARLPVRREAY